MDRHRWVRRLLVALLVAGVSSGVGGRTVSAAFPAGREVVLRVLTRPQRQASVLPPELARAVRRALGRTEAAPRPATTGTVSGVTWTQQTEITGTGGMANDYFGLSVALSGDTALVAAPYRSSGDGAVYVFVHRGSTWSQQAELADPCPCTSGDRFGNSVALSGTTALIGAPGKNGGYDGIGAAYVFVNSGTSWSQQAVLTATSGAAGDAFGQAVALSGDTALVGALGRQRNRGAAYVFVRHGTAWTRQAELTAADGARNDGFGSAVALSMGTALIGAPGKHSNRGAAYVFMRSGIIWNQQAELSDPCPCASGDLFGAAAALSAGTALVGAYGKNGGTGAAYVFGRSGTTWTQQAELTARDGAALDFFGNAVAVSADTALIGAYGKNGSSGAAYVFVRTGTTWAQQAELTARNGAPNAHFGSAVALSGGTALIGASYQSLTGAAYVFVRSPG